MRDVDTSLGKNLYNKNNKHHAKLCLIEDAFSFFLTKALFSYILTPTPSIVLIKGITFVGVDGSFPAF